jgi:hypothetical protein
MKVLSQSYEMTFINQNLLTGSQLNCDIQTNPIGAETNVTLK